MSLLPQAGAIPLSDIHLLNIKRDKRTGRVTGERPVQFLHLCNVGASEVAFIIIIKSDLLQEWNQTGLKLLLMTPTLAALGANFC